LNKWEKFIRDGVGKGKGKKMTSKDLISMFDWTIKVLGRDTKDPQHLGNCDILLSIPQAESK
jgi:hypothetical protein